uniref:Uncharacterized protein n=2 Tax=Clytia hemisphaerica TaxID=252671 RepID=A0A7M5XK20_9CNID
MAEEDKRGSEKKNSKWIEEIKDGLLYIDGREHLNWIPEVIGAVYNDGTLEGYIIQHCPSTEQNQLKKKNWRSYFTMHDMNSFTSIVKAMKNKASLLTIQYVQGTKYDHFLSRLFLKT